MFSITEQEISTKYFQRKRSKNTLMSDKCRLCKLNVEDIHHIASNCPQLSSSRYYLPLQHNVIAKCVYNKLLINDVQNRKLLQEPDQIYNTNEKEYWWDTPIMTATKVKHNKPDLVIWNKTEKICTVIEFSCPADINISKKIAEKTGNYGPLIRKLQIMYPQYRFMFVPIIVGTFGWVPKSLKVIFSVWQQMILIILLENYTCLVCLVQ